MSQYIIAGYGEFNEEATRQWYIAGYGLIIDPTSAGGVTYVSVSDSGTGADAIAGVGATLSLSDSGAGVDGLAALSAALGLADSMASTDAIAVEPLGTTIGLTDSGAGADAITGISAQVLLADSGAGAETILLAVALGLIDSGTGSDALAALGIFSAADSGAGSDLIADIQAVLSLAETGSGAETLSLDKGHEPIIITDSGQATEQVIGYPTAKPEPDYFARLSPRERVRERLLATLIASPEARRRIKDVLRRGQ